MSSATPFARADLTRVLCSVALDPGLDGMLLLDLPADALMPVVHLFCDLLRLRGEEPVRRVLGSADDDELWLTEPTPFSSSPVPIPGPVAGGPHGPAVLVVPDLVRAELAVVRAATATLSSPVVSIERHGVSVQTPARLYWLAACASADVGRLSPHLLDRFGVRFPAARALVRADRVDEILDAANGVPLTGPEIPRPASGSVRALQDAAPLPEVTPEAITYAETLHSPAHGARRPLALLRLARAGARLDGHPDVTRDDVETAAVLIQLIAPTLPTDARRPAEPPVDPPDAAPPDAPPDDADPPLDAAETTGPARGPVVETVLSGGPAQALTAADANLQATGRPYPEDVVEPDREAEPLRLPWQRRGAATGDRGTVVGTCPTRQIRDIAWTATIREAAKYQRVRGRGQPADRLLVTGADLRRHRRAPEAEHLLALVLDHTCRGAWDWLPALADQLQRAYVERAAVCLVEVGGAGAPLLRAERTVVRSLLHPRVATALQRGPGRATPLAHGLLLALETLRHALRHGRAPIASARLIVVTDGLGNVPLAGSLSGLVAEPVGDQGIRDALQVAPALGELRDLDSTVLVAPGAPHPLFTQELAAAIGPTCAFVVDGG